MIIVIKPKGIAVILLMALIFTPVFAETIEASSVHNFWQEFDITFWQTLPFATFWGHFIDRQLSALMFPGSTAHWNAIFAFATVVSAGNAFLHARRVVNEQIE